MQRLISGGDLDTSKLNVKPTWGVSFGLPQTGGVGPIGPPHPGNPLGYPGYGPAGGQGINLGPVSVNPLLAVQVTKDEYGEKVVKPYVNLHVTPNPGLVHKLGQLLAYKKYGLYGGHGGVYAPYHDHYHHTHHHTHQYEKPYYHRPPYHHLYPGSPHEAIYQQGGYYPPIYHKPQHHGGYYPTYKDYDDDDDDDYNDYDYANDYYRNARARNGTTRASGQFSSAREQLVASQGRPVGGNAGRPSGKVTFSDRRKRDATPGETASASASVEVRTIGSVRLRTDAD